MSIAWVMAQGADVVPIPGTKRRKYLDENAAANITLTDAELAAISDALPSGGRYPEANMRSIDR